MALSLGNFMIKKSNGRRVVVTGLGPVSAIGVGKVDFWNGILTPHYKPELKRVDVDGDVWEEYYHYKVKDVRSVLTGINESRFNEIGVWKQEEFDEDFLYLLAAIKLALEDSCLNYSGELENTGLVLGHENLGLMQLGSKLSHAAYKLLVEDKEISLTKKEFFKKFYSAFFKKGYDIQSFSNLFHISKLFGIHNYSLFINNACASGLYACDVASQIILSGLAKRVVVACSDYSDIYKFLWFKELGIYSNDGVIRPFSKKSNGLVFGDGGAAIVLEDMGEAIRRKAKIYAEYLGGGFDLEGWKITLPNLSNNSYQKAINLCLRRAHVKPENIDFLCPHGVGSNIIDYYEARAIEDVFGGLSQRPMISAFKPYFGHNLGGSALLETIVLLLALENSLIPPTLNSQGDQQKIRISLVDSAKKKNIQFAMKTCCAFAGYNSAAIFKKV